MRGAFCLDVELSDTSFSHEEPACCLRLFTERGKRPQASALAAEAAAMDVSECCGPHTTEFNVPPCNCTGWEIESNLEEIVWLVIMLAGAIFSVILHSMKSKKESRAVDETLAEFAAIRTFREYELKLREEQLEKASPSMPLDTLGKFFVAATPLPTSSPLHPAMFDTPRHDAGRSPDFSGANAKPASTNGLLNRMHTTLETLRGIQRSATHVEPETSGGDAGAGQHSPQRRHKHRAAHRHHHNHHHHNKGHHKKQHHRHQHHHHMDPDVPQDDCDTSTAKEATKKLTSEQPRHGRSFIEYQQELEAAEAAAAAEESESIEGADTHYPSTRIASSLSMEHAASAEAELLEAEELHHSGGHQYGSDLVEDPEMSGSM